MEKKKKKAWIGNHENKHTLWKMQVEHEFLGVGKLGFPGFFKIFTSFFLFCSARVVFNCD